MTIAVSTTGTSHRVTLTAWQVTERLGRDGQVEKVEITHSAPVEETLPRVEIYDGETIGTPRPKTETSVYIIKAHAAGDHSLGWGELRHHKISDERTNDRPEQMTGVYSTWKLDEESGQYFLIPIEDVLFDRIVEDARAGRIEMLTFEVQTWHKLKIDDDKNEKEVTPAICGVVEIVSKKPDVVASYAEDQEDIYKSSLSRDLLVINQQLNSIDNYLHGFGPSESGNLWGTLDQCVANAGESLQRKLSPAAGIIGVLLALILWRVW